MLLRSYDPVWYELYKDDKIELLKPTVWIEFRDVIIDSSARYILFCYIMT